MKTNISADPGPRSLGARHRTVTRHSAHRSRMTLALRAGVVATLAVLNTVAGAQQRPSSSPNAPESQRLILDWNRFAQQVIGADNGYLNPLPATRALAMMHLAMHDAINAAAPRYATYAILTRDQQADPAIAAAQAAHDVLAALYPGQKSAIRMYLEQYVDDAGVGPNAAKGVALGKRAAADIIAARANDNSASEEPYKEGAVPGAYRFVPGFDFVNMPHWRTVRPFALTSPAQFRVKPPPALAGADYARAFEEVRRKGGKQSDARTRDESHYAMFWYELSDIGWNRIARVVAHDHPQDLWTTARTFALLNAALADSYIAGWDSKMHYDFWRPISAIRLAAEDGNRATMPAPAWEPFLTTPPVQDYPSTHSVLGAAGAVVLAHAFGRDDVAFTFTSLSADSANPVRSFRSFSEAARENAESRIMAGIHFRFAIETGLTLGQDIGRYTVKTLLPVAGQAVNDGASR